jgi:hypothetical protein
MTSQVKRYRESQGKKRKRSRRDPREDLALAVKAALADRSDITVEENPAGDWLTLGFNVNVPDEYTAQDVVELANVLLGLPSLLTFVGESGWQWLVGIYRAGELVQVLKPGDEHLHVCSTCGYVQRASRALCLQCGSTTRP